MTDERQPTDWSDERLTEAFRARAGAHETPRRLAATAIGSVRGASRTTTRGPRRAHLGGLAAAGVVVAIGAALLAQPIADKSADTMQALGLQILTVSQAIAVRDSDGTDREIAVRGYFSPAPSVPCPAPAVGTAISPIALDCPMSMQWLLQDPERLVTSTSNSLEGHAPVGPAIQPLFPFIDMSAVVTAGASGGADPAELVVIGHFRDRRAVMCGPAGSARCEGFVVDRVESVNGGRVGVSTVIDVEPYATEQRREPVWTPDDADRLLLAAVPGLSVLSRVALPGHRIGEVEPSLATGAHRIIDRPIVWVVSVLDGSSGASPPVRRTFLLVDGTDEAYEAVPWDVSNVGFVPFVAPSKIASEEPSPTASAAPSSVDFPTEALGLPVISVSQALDRLSGDFDDTELAVRGHYLADLPIGRCPEPFGVPRDEPVCPAGVNWLLDEREQLRRNPDGTTWLRPHVGWALNPDVRPESPFDVPNLWFDTGPDPLPVVVVGHFADRRWPTSDRFRRFVVDALVWRAGTVASTNPVRLTDAAVARPADVQALVEAELGPADTTWLAVVPGERLTEIDPVVGTSARELSQARAIWMVRRLVTVDGRSVLRTAYVEDGRERVWAETEGHVFELATTIDIPVGAADDGTVVAEVVDSSDILVGARPVSATDAAGEFTRRVGSDLVASVELANVPGQPNEVVVRWVGGACDRTWHLGVYRSGQSGAITVLPYVLDRDETCRLGGVPRALVLQFAQPTRAEGIQLETSPSGG